MTLSMYQASVPGVQRTLKRSTRSSTRPPPSRRAQDRSRRAAVGAALPDMFPLTRQVQIATDLAKGCRPGSPAWRVPSFADTEKTFAELKARIAKTLDFLGAPQARSRSTARRHATSPSRPARAS